MATSIPSEVMPSTNACVVCLEKAERLKVVGLCRHAFCEPCLTKHLKDAKEVFPCPSCQSECPIPSDGIASLEDLISSEDASSVALTTSEDIQHSVDDAEVPPQNCSVCDTLKVTSNRAVSFCDKCDMFFCEECGDGHRNNTAIKGHVLRAIGAATSDSSGICAQHGRSLKMFCRPCAIPCCGLCVHCNHRDHEVCSVKDMIDAAATELGKVLKFASDMTDYLGIQESGTFSARRAKLDWKEAVTHAVEEKAEQCIDNILQQKAKLLKIVDEDCNTSSEEQYLRDVARFRGEFRPRIEEGTRLLINTAADLNHLKLLNDMKANIEDDFATRFYSLGTAPERPEYRPTRGSSGFILHSRQIFKEESYPVRSIGRMVDDHFSRAEKMHDLQLPADMKFSNIQEIRCLGKFGYAVVCQSGSKEPHYMMMIFDADGKFERAEHDLPPVYGMDVDAHDKIVLLLSGKSVQMFLLKVYDTTGRNAESSREFVQRKPLSMAISPEGRCNILCEGPGDVRHITVVDLKGNVLDLTGNVLQTAQIAYEGIHDHSRIACSGNTIYTMGSSFIGVFKYEAGKIIFLKPLQLPSYGASDIAVDFFHNIFVLMPDQVNHWPWSVHRHTSPTQKLQPRRLTGSSSGKRIHFQSHKLLIAGTHTVTVYRLR